ncbi:hypothetical protein ACRAR1_23705 [Streptomyces sanyensis]|uniref:hypothetical protein n=1 Tax=Streptomyces sanyensis TaxID=568869 RepID=UPI003D77AD9E
MTDSTSGPLPVPPPGTRGVPAPPPGGSGAPGDPDGGPPAGALPSAVRGTGAPGAPAASGEQTDPAAPAPLGVARTPTGNTAVDTLVARLADLDHLAADGHTEVYEDVHRGLRDALTALDSPPGPRPPETGSQGHPARPHDHRS